MDEFLSFSQNIEFKITFRGYDLRDVDAYVERVAKTAALVQSRIAELQRQAEVVETVSSESEATLIRTLVLAQRAADAAVAEAQKEAALLSGEAETERASLLAETQAETETLRREAEDHASRLLAEAELDRRQILADAGTVAAARSVEERNRLADDVRELEQYRSFLSDDVEILERHLADQRRALAASLSALTELIEEPGAFRASAAPATSGAEMDITAFGAVAGSEPVADEEPADDVAAVDESAGDGLTFNPAPVPEPVGDHDETAAIDLMEIEADAPEDDALEDDALEGRAPVYGVAGEPPRLVTVADLDKSSTELNQTAAHDSVVAEPVIEVVSAGPGAGSAEPVGVSTAEHQVLPDLSPEDDALVFQESEPATSADPFLEQLRDAVASEEPADFGDDALAAFFDQNDADSDRSWFNRRR